MIGRRGRQTGFSLLELVVAMGLFTVIMGLVFKLVSESQQSFGRNQSAAEAHQNAEFAALRVTEILRAAGANPANIPSINVLSFIRHTTSGDATSVNILSDLNGNGTSNDNVEGALPFTSDYFILTSENVTLRHNEDAHTIELVDNTTDGSSSVTLAENIETFQVEILENSREAKVTITATPSVRFAKVAYGGESNHTVVTQTRLRNRF
jgi:prepilin-type N-terminal cleavage/methylation domain-containing protein